MSRGLERAVLEGEFLWDIAQEAIEFGVWKGLCQRESFQGP